MRKILYSLYQWVFFIPIFIVITFITAMVVIIMTPLFGRKYWGYYPPKLWCKLTCWFSLCRVKTEGHENLEKDKSYIFVANHQGAFDIFLIYGFLKHNIIWMQKQSLRTIPLVGFASKQAGHVFVNNSSPTARATSIIKAKENIIDGVSLVIFPEGSRTLTGKMGRFKMGAYYIANEMDLPIVPLTINGSFEVLKRNTLNMKPGKLELIIHKPIPADQITEETIPAIVNETREVIHSDLWERYKD